MTQSRSTVKRARRFATAALTGVVALSVVPAGTASAQTADPPAPTSVEAFCVNVPPRYNLFDDVVDAHTFAEEIRCLGYAAITYGVSPRVYAPSGTVSREQMASFLVRMMDVAVDLDLTAELNELPDYDGTNDFDDIVEFSAHARSVNRLVDAGITIGGPGGLPDTSYGPALPVSREQMASFITRALEYLTGTPRSSPDDYFTDDDTSVHEDNINALAEAGISVGDGSTRYRPGQLLTRGQMSAYLIRSLANYEIADVIARLPNPAPLPDDTTSTSESVDHGNGTATISFIVRDDGGLGIDLLSGADFQLTLPDATTVDLDTLLTDFPDTWSDFTEVDGGNGLYTVLLTAEPGTYTYTDITALGVELDPSIEVTITG